MKILIVSDTHRKDVNLREILERSGRLDMLIHLGDAEGSEQEIASWVNEGCDLEFVLGNNDFFSNLDREKDIMIGRYRVLLTHGHYYSVSLGPERMIKDIRWEVVRMKFDFKDLMAFGMFILALLTFILKISQ